MKKTIVGMVTGIVALLMMGACSTANVSDTDYVGFCMDRVHNWRVPDSTCGNSTIAYWDYVDVDMYLNFSYPAYYRQLPPNVVVVHTAPRNTIVVKNLGTNGGLARNLSAIKNSVSSRINKNPVTKTIATQPTKNSNGIIRGGFGVPKKTISH